MKYMLLMYSEESSWTDDERQRCLAKSIEVCHELAAEGKYVSASPLHPVATATSIRMQTGKPLVTDGPFAETREQLGGYYLVEAADLDEAIAIAHRLPGLSKGTVEIRPIWELDNLPDAR